MRINTRCPLQENVLLALCWRSKWPTIECSTFWRAGAVCWPHSGMLCSYGRVALLSLTSATRTTLGVLFIITLSKIVVLNFPLSVRIRTNVFFQKLIPSHVIIKSIIFKDSCFCLNESRKLRILFKPPVGILLFITDIWTPKCVEMYHIYFFLNYCYTLVHVVSSAGLNS